MKKIAIFGLCLIAAQVNAGSLTDWFVDLAKANHLGAETIVIAPGYKVTVAGKAVPIFGNQLCPRPDGSHVWFIGGDPDGGAGCIVVQKNTSTVPVQLVVAGKPLMESWTVERRGTDQMLLRRPNGEYIVPAK